MEVAQATKLFSDQFLKMIPSLFASLEMFVEGTVAVSLTILWVLLLALYLARPYMIRTLQKFSLRVGADLWWLLYVGLRDLVLAVVFVMGLLYFLPDVLGMLPLPITGPLAEALLFAVLAVKLTRDADNDPKAFSLVSTLLGAGTVLYVAPFVLAEKLGGFAGTRFDWLVTTVSPLAGSTASGVALICWGTATLAAIILGSVAVTYTMRLTKPNEQEV
ncbi:MAG TPA: hypothetical protein VKW09_06140 [bacterium]|nr:hypothetical protein [bacterium]